MVWYSVVMGGDEEWYDEERIIQGDFRDTINLYSLTDGVTAEQLEAMHGAGGGRAVGLDGAAGGGAAAWLAAAGVTAAALLVVLAIILIKRAARKGKKGPKSD